MEYAQQGQLITFISQTGNFSQRVCRAYFQQILSALIHMNERGISHRDLKPDNILLDRLFNIKITDFGSAGIAAASSSPTSSMAEGGSQSFAANYNDKSQKFCTYCGTIQYMAPEVLKRKEYNGFKADIFSLG